jgi:hypothetical protein
METQGMEKTTSQMAENETIQKAFSNGRIHVMQDDREAKRFILENTIREQEMIMTEPKLHEQMLNTQNASRKKAMKDTQMQTEMLQQNVNEQYLALRNPETSHTVKHFSIKVNESILNDEEIKKEFLLQNIKAFDAIAKDPSLRSRIADPMLIIMKDPKIKKEMEKMIKMAIAKEMQKMQAQMKQMMQAQMQQMKQQMSQKKSGSTGSTDSPSGDQSFPKPTKSPSDLTRSEEQQGNS